MKTISTNFPKETIVKKFLITLSWLAAFMFCYSGSSFSMAGENAGHHECAHHKNLKDKDCGCDHHKDAKDKDCGCDHHKDAKDKDCGCDHHKDAPRTKK